MELIPVMIIVTSLYWTYVPNAVKSHKAAIIAAWKYFLQSLEQEPDNIKINLNC